MKVLVSVFVMFFAGLAYGSLHCEAPIPEITTEWIDIVEPCVNAMRGQIQKEIDASYHYLAMGAHFSRDTVNRPGFADMFFKSAKEEREHAEHLIEYLSMRGKLNDSVTGLITFPTIEKQMWKSGVDALNDALNLEAMVTKSIRKLIITCEQDPNDYHLVDYLTGVYLEEQYKGQRELAGKLSTLKKMMNKHGEIGEFLFDKTLS